MHTLMLFVPANKPVELIDVLLLLETSAELRQFECMQADISRFFPEVKQTKRHKCQGVCMPGCSSEPFDALPNCKLQKPTDALPPKCKLCTASAA